MKTFTAIPRSLALGMLLAAASLFGSAAAADRVNINTADAAAIDAALVNLGRTKAEAIVPYRANHGACKRPVPLAQVKGICLQTGEKKYERRVINASEAAQKTEKQR